MYNIQDYEIPHENADCSEIAEDLLRLTGQGKCLQVESSDSTMFRVRTHDSKETYYYHVVYVTDDNLVYDLRRSYEPIKLSDYKKDLKRINIEKTLKFKTYKL